MISANLVRVQKKKKKRKEGSAMGSRGRKQLGMNGVDSAEIPAGSEAILIFLYLTKFNCINSGALKNFFSGGFKIYLSIQKGVM